MKIDKGSFINDFIDRNLRQYIIPVYQRNYKWSKEQCKQLFEDIIQAHKLDRYHFTGPIVYELLKTENKIDYYIIIDGQQRLTTIYILLKALIDVAKTDAEKERLQTLLFNQDKFKEYDINDSSKLKLKPIKSDNQSLMLLMNDNIGSDDKESGIYQNYDLFCELIRKELQDDRDLSIEKIYDGIQHLTCAMIKLEEEEKGIEQEIFERINSTGVPLGLADKIRNFVLMTDVEQDRLYNEYWLQIETMLSEKELSSFFLDYINFKMEGFTKEKDAYDDFKTLYKEKDYTNESMLSELLHYAKQYKIFLSKDESIGTAANDALEGLRQLKQTTVYLFLFSVFDDFENNIIDRDTLTKVLQLLLNYSVRRLACEIPSNSLRGFYKTLYPRIFGHGKNKEYYCDAITSFLMQLTSKDVMPSDDTFTLALKERDIYPKKALCRLLLISVESQTKEKLDMSNMSIEHIMPQNNNLSKSWRDMLGENWKIIHSKYLHTIGNLTLTGYNSELGDKSFEEKKAELKDPKSHITILNKDVINKDKWTEEEIENRADELCKSIKGIFPIKDPERKIEFRDDRYKEYTVFNPDDATSKQVNYYELLGERVNVSKFIDMVHSVAEKLYDLDSDVIEKLARSDAALLGNKTMFSYDKKVANNAKELKKGGGIYMSTGFSAANCIRIIGELLKRYELNLEEDFLYSARSLESEQAE